MGVTTFAAIDVGSYNVCMDIYEISPRNGIRCVNEVRSRLEIGRETYGEGKITFATAKELCRILKDFTEIMKEYQAEAYRASQRGVFCEDDSERNRCHGSGRRKCTDFSF